MYEKSVYFVALSQKYCIMAKEKKGGKRLNKRQVAELLIDFFKSSPNEVFSFKQIFKALKLNTHPLKMLAIDLMEEMAWDDVLTKVSDNSYRLNNKGQILEGTFIRKPNGKNSFLPDGNEKPIFVSERNSMFALNGDRVRVTMLARRRFHIREAMVTEIISHARDTFVGRIVVEEDMAFLVTDNNIYVNDIIIPKRKLKGGTTGDKAVVKVTQWPSRESKNIVGEVIDVLGPTGENNAEMHAILAQYGLPYRYPEALEREADKITGEITAEDYAERDDFRPVWTCTIDPQDAKDFDDALSMRRKDGLWEVGVHIADVSHYVTEGSPIDKEARQRATSVYLVDRTIPMLPEHLCNFVCSLRPDEEKLCYSVVFLMDNDAQVKSFRIVHTVIRSNRRYAYEEAQNMIVSYPTPADKRTVEQMIPAIEQAQQDGSERTADEWGQLYIPALDLLAKKLRKQRFAQGAVNFDSEEMKFDIDEKGKPLRCYFKHSTDATQLIEEFMLLANRTVAESVGKVKTQKGKKQGAKGKEQPSAKTLPYRIHDNPDPQKLETLREFVAKFGYRLSSASTKGATSRSLNKLMAESEGHKEQKLIQMVALRAMMKAKYSTHNIGHFGLAFDYYTHFTSPIRRYPDTMVHRLLTRYQQGAKSANREKYEELCEHCSDMEQIAANAERDSVKYKMVEFMADKLGEVFKAHISGIQSFGLYCEIDENHCEGLVSIHDLGRDYYEFDEKNYCLVGRRRHHRYQLGDEVTIKVARANVEKRQLNFILVE